MTEQTATETAGSAAPTVDPNDPAIRALIEAEAAKREEGLKKNRDELKAEKLRLQEEMKRFDGIDPEEVRKILDERKNAAEEEAKNKGQWQELLDSKEKRWTGEREKLVSSYEEKITKLTGELHKRMIDSELNAALDAVKVAAPLRNAAKAVLKAGVDVVEDVETGGYKVVARFGGDELDVVSRVKAWADSDEGQYFVEAPRNSGGGAQGSGRGGSVAANPWKTNSLSEQGKLVRENPQLARQYIKEAGKNPSSYGL